MLIFDFLQGTWWFMGRDVEMVELENVWCVGSSTLAIQVSIDDRLKWIPKSLVGKDGDVQAIGDKGTLIIPEWFAVKEGLV